MNEADNVMYQRQITLGQYSIFRVQKCEIKQCDQTMPKGMGKRWCSKAHQELSVIQERVKAMLDSKKTT